MIKASLLLQVGLIANVKLYFCLFLHKSTSARHLQSINHLVFLNPHPEMYIVILLEFKVIDKSPFA